MNEAQIARLKQAATEWAFPLAGKIVGVLFVLWLANRVARWLSSAMETRLEKAEFDLTLTRFGARMVHYVIMVGAVLGCLGSFGIETTSFAAVIGAAGFAVGLAFQGTLANFSSGVMLLVFRPFDVGQFVKAGGQDGTVAAIGIFTTKIDTPDRRRIIVPNSAIFGSTIVNVSHHPVRRVDVDVGVDYSADVDVTREVLQKAIASIEDVEEEPASAVVLVGLGASSVDWTVRVWTRGEHFWAVKEALTRAIKVELDAAGIGIPYQTVDVNITSLQGSIGAGAAAS